MARIVGAPKVATGLSEAREAAGAIAEPRIARECNANAEREMLCISRFVCEAKSHPKNKNKNSKLDICPSSENLENWDKNRWFIEIIL